MEIVAILGSPHGMKGNTGLLLNELLGAAKEAGAKTRLFLLSEHAVKPCGACDACHKTGKCPVKDDFRKIAEAMGEADGIVLASPNYIFSVSAQMKALLDRCCGPLHCQSFEGKHAAAVVTSGGAGSDEVERYLLRFLNSLGCWTAGSVGAQAAQLAGEPSRAQRIEAAGDLGRRLVESIRGKKEYPDQVKAKAEFHERMKQLVAWRKDDWPYEYQYWKSRGRL